MLYKVRCRPAFAALFVTLNPGESIIVRAGSMVSLDTGVSLKTQVCGGRLLALLRKCFGGELLSVDQLSNTTNKSLTVVLGHSTMGDIARLDLSQGSICLQPGVYLAHTSGVTVQNHWAGLGSWLAGDGLWKVKLKGKGRVFIGGYGGIIKKMVYGDFVVTQGNLLAHSPKLRLKYHQEEESVNIVVRAAKTKNQRTQGNPIYCQSRNLQGLIDYLRSLA
ncbi:TIGR00266 family protein [Crocosphaera sp. UHCC 0190]|uniref:TIGR00266 family protein n=1 Tax=Crocosphaera sp. UHCC 0190 TaxID=3110246 RepID=UPI002B211564|nr:TIGR00266 family protein [Crocosphaera sp. UHCC 0190]MEA5511526.1 TIGR00266 family protein [Crocosphaera sp. UHCC 0190]